MKKLYIVIIILLISNQINSQKNNDKYPKFKFGLNVGPNYTSLRGNFYAGRETAKYDPQFNFFGGLFFEYKLDKHLSIVANLNYENKSVESNYLYYDSFLDFNPEHIEDQIKFKYINLPILLRCHFGGDNNLFLNTGIFVNNLIDVENIITNTDTGEKYNALDFNSFFDINDIGLVLGIGSNFNISSRNCLSIELRDDYGIQDINSLNLYYENYTSKTNSIKLILTWSFSNK